MKVHVEVDMTPEEARRFMGLPDVAPLQEKMLAEMQARVKAALLSERAISPSPLCQYRPASFQNPGKANISARSDGEMSPQR